MLSEAKRRQVIARALASVGTLWRVLMFWAATDYMPYRQQPEVVCGVNVKDML